MREQVMGDEGREEEEPNNTGLQSHHEDFSFYSKCAGKSVEIFEEVNSMI